MCDNGRRGWDPKRGKGACPTAMTPCGACPVVEPSSLHAAYLGILILTAKARFRVRLRVAAQGRAGVGHQIVSKARLAASRQLDCLKVTSQNELKHVVCRHLTLAHWPPLARWPHRGSRRGNGGLGEAAQLTPPEPPSRT